MGCIWWEQISKAKRFLGEITDCLLDGKSVLLTDPENIPWKHVMYEAVEDTLHSENAEYRLEQFYCPNEDPGMYLMEHYCKREKRASYRPGKTAAEFLAENEDIVLHQRYLWITNIPESQLASWCAFITEYNRCIPHGYPHAAFVLETTGRQVRCKSAKGICKLCFQEAIQSYDRFAFCAVVSADVAITEELRPYLAELAAIIGGKDLELCDICVRRGESLLKNCAETLQQLQQEEIRSDGSLHEVGACLEQLDTLLWEAQIKLIFPAIQKYISQFIHLHFEELAHALPITDAFDQVIDTPHDLEAGQLLRLVTCQKVSASSTEYADLKCCRDARNDLAHLSPVEFDKVKHILLLQK